jgi:Tfp pilus assembly protein PilX
MHSPPAKSRRRLRPRGSVYIFVLGVATLVTVIGLSFLAVTRLSARANVHANDATEAEALAEAAVEYALSAIAGNPSWRTTYSNGVQTAPKTLGGGTISFKLVDGTDGDLANNATDPVRVYGIGRTRTAVKVYSVVLAAQGQGLSVLKTVFHAGGNLDTSAGVTATGGPLSSNANFFIHASCTVHGDVQAVSFRIDGTVDGNTTTLPSPLPMPSGSAFDIYLGMATEIPFAGLSGGTLQSALLSPSSNPYGTANARGVYHIQVPKDKTLTVKNVRLVATLLVTLGSGAKFRITSSSLLEPPQADFPTLLIRAPDGGTADFNGGSSALSETTAGVSFNPPGTPYPWPTGTSDTDTTDTYPAEFRGLGHMIGTSLTTTVGAVLVGRGTIIMDGPANASAGMTMTHDPGLFANPPAGYASGNVMVPAPGTWRWEQSP